MSEPDPFRSDPSKPNPGDNPRRPRPDNRRGAIAGLVIAAAMLAVGLWLAHALTAQSRLQDCLMSGRTNCNVIEPAR
jgi:hypothetical protein